MNRRTWIGQTGAAVAATTLGARGLGARPAAPQGRVADPDIERWMRQAFVPGLAMARVTVSGVETRGFGVRTRDGGQVVNGDTIFAAASLSKPVFAWVVLSLVDDGLLALERPLHDYVPVPNADDERSRLVTARHVLSHSGGWRNWRNNVATRLVADFEPGSRFGYSGEGYFHLQRVVEKLTGRSLSLLARERVFEPLGLRSTSFATLPGLEDRRAAGHTNRGDPARDFGAMIRPALARKAQERGVTVEALMIGDSEAALREADPNLPVLPNFLQPNAAASMTTTASDFGRFLQHLLRVHGTASPAAAIVERMLRPQVRISTELHWGLGTGLEVSNGRTVAWHWGDNPGFKNFYILDPQARSAIVVFTSGDGGQGVYERVIRAETGQDRAAFLFL